MGRRGRPRGATSLSTKKNPPRLCRSTYAGQKPIKCDGCSLTLCEKSDIQQHLAELHKTCADQLAAINTIKASCLRFMEFFNSWSRLLGNNNNDTLASEGLQGLFTAASFSAQETELLSSQAIKPGKPHIRNNAEKPAKSQSVNNNAKTRKKRGRKRKVAPESDSVNSDKEHDSKRARLEELEPEEASEPAEEASEPAEEASEPAEEASEPGEEASGPGEEASEPAEESQEDLEKPLICGLCKGVFILKKELLSHFKAAHADVLSPESKASDPPEACSSPEKPSLDALSPCPECPKQFRDKRALSAHCETKHGRTTYACLFPGCRVPSFDSEAERVVHVQRAHRMSTCDFCKESNFLTSKALQVHLSICDAFKRRMEALESPGQEEAEERAPNMKVENNRGIQWNELVQILSPAGTHYFIDLKPEAE